MNYMLYNITMNAIAIIAHFYMVHYIAVASKKKLITLIYVAIVHCFVKVFLQFLKTVSTPLPLLSCYTYMNTVR